MYIDACHDGWKRIATGLDIELKHGVPVRICNTTSNKNQQLDIKNISDKVHELTGFTVSVNNWINISQDEQERSICVDRNEFIEVLRRLALASAAMFVDRFHKPVDNNAVDWDVAEYAYDFNQAIEHCCINYGTLNRDYYYQYYIKIMHEESVRLIENGISPMVPAE